MKTTIYRFDPVIYPFPLLVATNLNEEEMKDLFYIVTDKRTASPATTEFSPDPTIEAVTCIVLTRETTNIYFLVMVHTPEKMTAGLVAHEAFHTTVFNSNWLNLGALNLESDEAGAYYIGWATDCIWNVLQGTPEKMKGELITKKSML